MNLWDKKRFVLYVLCVLLNVSEAKPADVSKKNLCSLHHDELNMNKRKCASNKSSNCFAGDFCITFTLGSESGIDTMKHTSTG